MLNRPFYKHATVMGLIANFTPNWFGMTMGTGITAICLNTLAPLVDGARTVASGLWLLNIVFFAVFSLLFIVRGICFPESWSRMLKHPLQPMFLGCIPMGLATILNGFIIFGIQLYGNSSIEIALSLWWIDVALSLASILVVPYFMFKHHEHSMANMTGVWLLPFVACEVAAASGALMLPYLDHYQSITYVVISLMLWFASVSLALSILVILFQRLALHKLPSSDLASSVFLPLGPTGTGALGMLLLSNNVHDISQTTATPALISLLNLLPGIGMFIGIAMWTLATWWLLIAIIATIHYIRIKALKFNLGFWAYTFPLGVYTMATVNLASLMKSNLIHLYAVLLVIILCIIWVFVFLRTLTGFYGGGLINDPTLKS